MAQVNRVTGFFLVLGVVILVVSVTGTLYVTNGGQRQTGDAPDANVGAEDAWGSGLVDAATGLQYPTPGVPGVVAAVLVKEDVPVKAGDVLVRLNDATARAELIKLKSALAV